MHGHKQVVSYSAVTLLDGHRKICEIYGKSEGRKLRVCLVENSH